MYYLKPFQNVSIDNISKSEFSIIQNKGDLFKALKILSNNETLNNFNYWTTWSKLSNQEKLKKYD